MAIKKINVNGKESDLDLQKDTTPTKDSSNAITSGAVYKLQQQLQQQKDNPKFDIINVEGVANIIGDINIGQDDEIQINQTGIYTLNNAPLNLNGEPIATKQDVANNIINYNSEGIFVKNAAYGVEINSPGLYLVELYGLSSLFGNSIESVFLYVGSLGSNWFSNCIYDFTEEENKIKVYIFQCLFDYETKTIHLIEQANSSNVSEYSMKVYKIL